jgi:fructose-bisphosphate aldolase class II
MGIVNARQIIDNAHTHRYAIGHFNTNNLEWTQAILRAAESQKSPVIIAASMGAAKYMGGTKMVVDMIRDLYASLNISVPVAIHLDHGDLPTAQQAIKDGFTSVMFDGSSLPFADNIALTKQLVAEADAADVSVEAEVGSIGGTEDGIVGLGDIAEVGQVVEMANTGITMLAAGIGNIHGVYPKDFAGLKLDVLAEFEEATNHEMPFVLHGASGLPDDQIRTAIDHGVSKVNINSQLQWAFHKALREFIVSDQDLQGTNYDPRKLLKPGFDAAQATAEHLMQLLGSTGQAL